MSNGSLNRDGSDNINAWVTPRLEKFAIWACLVGIMFFWNTVEGLKNRVEVSEKQIIVLSQEKISRVELRAFEDRVTAQLTAISTTNKADLNDMKSSLVERMDLIIKSINAKR
jgi:hypothetical protein